MIRSVQESLAAFWRGSRNRRALLTAVAVIVVVGICLSPNLVTVGWMMAGLSLLILLLWVPAFAIRNRVLSTRLRPELMLLITSLWLCLLVGEAVLRIFFFPMFPQLEGLGLWGDTLGYRYDRTLGWAPVPNSHKTFTYHHTITIAHNRDGFRDQEPVFDQRPAMVFLGDSFVWAYDVEASDRFTEVLRRRHPEWRVFNFGVCGYSTDQEYLQLKQHFASYQPKVVFLVFCTENDDVGNRSNICGDDWYFKPYYLVGAQGLELRGVPVPRSERVLFLQHPWLFKPYLVRLGLRAWQRAFDPTPRFDKSPTPDIIAALKRYVTGRGAAFYVGLTRGDAELERFLRSADIPYVDLSTELRSKGDGHWTSAGHILVADKIEEFLVSAKVLKPAEVVEPIRSEGNHK